MASDKRVGERPSVIDLPLRRSGEPKPLAGIPAQREKEILAAAVDLFHEEGYASTTVDDVARAVGIHKASLYHYIDSKEDLLDRIVALVHEDADRIYFGVAGRTDLTALERLRECVRQLTLYKANYVQRYAVALQDRGKLNAARRAKMRLWRAEREQYFERWLAEAMETGELPGGIDTELASFMARAVTSTVYKDIRSHKASPEVLAAFTARFVVEGIRGSVGPLDVAPVSPPAVHRRSKRKSRRAGPSSEPAG
jgi:AcrR family transcriptional regulator